VPKIAPLREKPERTQRRLRELARQRKETVARLKVPSIIPRRQQTKLSFSKRDESPPPPDAESKRNESPPSPHAETTDSEDSDDLENVEDAEESEDSGTSTYGGARSAAWRSSMPQSGIVPRETRAAYKARSK